MGVKLLWTGLTIMQANNVLPDVPGLQVAGGIIMVIGCIVMWLNK